MIQLTVYPATFGEPTASPFCMKSICMFEASRLPYDLIETADPRSAPKGKLPFIDVDGELIPDSEQIRTFIETTADMDFNSDLSEHDRGVSQALIRMVEEHLYFAIYAERWAEDDNWEHIRKAFFNEVPAIIRGFVTRSVRKQALAQLSAQGLGRHSPQERFERVRRDLISIRDVLGDKRFLFGDKPSAADFSVVPMLRAALATPIEKPIGAFIRNDTILMNYVTNGTDTFYPKGV